MGLKQNIAKPHILSKSNDVVNDGKVKVDEELAEDTAIRMKQLRFEMEN